MGSFMSWERVRPCRADRCAVFYGGLPCRAGPSAMRVWAKLVVSQGLQWDRAVLPDASYCIVEAYRVERVSTNVCVLEHGTLPCSPRRQPSGASAMRVSLSVWAAVGPCRAFQCVVLYRGSLSSGASEFRQWLQAGSLKILCWAAERDLSRTSLDTEPCRAFRCAVTYVDLQTGASAIRVWAKFVVGQGLQWDRAVLSDASLVC
jgi:hypothetical protein